jgi:ligand-binding sensor domain-containing protein
MTLITAIVIGVASLGYTGMFEEGDWVNYTNFRFVTSAATDRDIVYFGTTGGVIRYDRIAGKWLEPLTVTDGIPDEHVDNIAYDPEWDRVWVSTPNGAAYYQPSFERWYTGGEFPSNLARNDFNPGLYPLLATEFGYSYQDGQLTDPYLQRYSLTRGVSDGYDDLFVGTWGLGPVVINTRYRELKLISFGPYNNDVSAAVELGDLIVTGSGFGDATSEGLTFYDKRTGRWQWYEPRLITGLASSRLTSAVESNDAIWLGTTYGLVRYSKTDSTFRTFADFSFLPSEYISSVARDSVLVYAGTDNGLGYIDLKGRRKHEGKDEPPDSADLRKSAGNAGSADAPAKERLLGWHINRVRTIGQYLYVASEEGALRRRINDGGKFEFLNTPDGMLSTEIFDIASSGDSLYFATRDDIVIINTKTEEYGTVTDQRYFGSWNILEIVPDGENIWSATDIGLWKYRLSDNYSRLFTAADGMISDDIRTIFLDGDYIWIATPEGLIRFFWNDPGRID